jgi:hypothetical protein
LALKLETAGKVRVFAIPTYWVQALLKPVHTAIFALLRTIPTDCTFAQTSGWSAAISARACEYFSADLSAATDRFPALLQELFLGTVLAADGGGSVGHEFARLWRTIIQGDEWAHKVDEVDDDGTSPFQGGRAVVGTVKGPKGESSPYVVEGTPFTFLRYGVGQPMGAYSS